jgi:hypothetical protein
MVLDTHAGEERSKEASQIETAVHNVYRENFSEAASKII